MIMIWVNKLKYALILFALVLCLFPNSSFADSTYTQLSQVIRGHLFFMNSQLFKARVQCHEMETGDKVVIVYRKKFHTEILNLRTQTTCHLVLMKSVN